MSGTATVIENGKANRRKAGTVYEQGRRVHGWWLKHDLAVGVCGDFETYWAWAQVDGQRRRAV